MNKKKQKKRIMLSRIGVIIAQSIIVVTIVRVIACPQVETVYKYIYAYISIDLK